MNKRLETVLKIGSTEALIEELYKILYNSITNNGTSGVISKVTTSKAIQNLEEYFSCKIFLNSDKYYAFESDTLRFLCNESEMLLAIQAAAHELSLKYKPFEYMSLKVDLNCTVYKVFVHDSVDLTQYLNEISKRNAEVVTKSLLALINTIDPSDSIAHWSDKYNKRIANITAFFDEHGFSTSLEETILEQVLQDFESGDGKDFADSVQQHTLAVQAKKDAELAKRKNIIALWKMFLIFAIPAFLIYYFI